MPARSAPASSAPASAAGVRHACVAPSGTGTTTAPAAAAWTAANRFIDAVCGPGSHTREPGPMPVSSDTAGKESTQDAAVRTTDRGHVVVPEVRTAIGRLPAAAQSPARHPPPSRRHPPAPPRPDRRRRGRPRRPRSRPGRLVGPAEEELALLGRDAARASDAEVVGHEQRAAGDGQLAVVVDLVVAGGRPGAGAPGPQVGPR